MGKRDPGILVSTPKRENPSFYKTDFFNPQITIVF